MQLTHLLLFIATEAMFSASPGPAVAMVISASMIGGRKAAYAAIMGVLIGNLIYFIVSAGLLMFSLSLSDRVFEVMRWVGAAYILYILFKEYIPALIKLGTASAEESGSQLAATTKQQQKSPAKYFYTTLAMQLSNPKTIIFFTAFLPQFINPESNPAMQFLILAILSFITELIILLLYARASRYAIDKFENKGLGRTFENIGNATMVLAVIWGIVSYY